MILIKYAILEKRLTTNLIETDIKLFRDWDTESLLEEIKLNKYYYKIKYIKYPIISIDFNRLAKWAIENKYLSDASDKEKSHIKWDGTKTHLINTFKNGPRILLKARLTKWVKNRQKYDARGLLTNDSPIIPHFSLFYKKISDGEDRYEWTFPSEITNTKIYNYIEIVDNSGH